MGGVALASASANAQIDNGLPGPQPLDAGAMILNRQLLSGIMDHNQEVRGGKPDRNAAGVLVYRRSPRVTERVKRDYLARAEKAYGSSTAASLRRMLATRDFVAMWAKGAAADGMSPNDLGDSLAEYWTTNWAIVHGDFSAAPALTKAVRFQIGPSVARVPQIRRMSDAQKQELSEGLMLNLVVEVIGVQAAKQGGDPALMRRLQTQTAARFKREFGVDLNAVRITNRGMVRA